MAFDDTATVSGSVAYFSDGADDVPTKSLVVTIPPTLSGVSSVTVENDGNLCDFDNYNVEANTNTTVALGADLTLKKGTYTLAFNISDTVTATRNRPCYVINGNYTYADSDYKTSGRYSWTFTLADDTTLSIRWWAHTVSANITISNFMLTYGSTAHAYEPYQTPTQYTASLGRTIYGGQVDIVNGAGQETYQEIDLGSLTWVYASASSRFYANLHLSGIYTNFPTNANELADITCADYETITFSSLSGDTSLNNKVAGVTTDAPFITIRDTRFSDATAFKNAVTGKKAVIPLATPTDFTFTGQEIPTKLGYNAFWSEQGDSEVTYYKDGYGFTSVTVNKTGKNLFNKNAVEQHTWIIVDNTETETRSNINFLTSDYIPVCANTRYYVSAKSSNRAAYYDRNKNGIAYFSFSGGASFNCLYDGYIRLTIKDDTDLDTFIVNKGSEAIPYEPFGISKTAKLHKVIYGGQADVVRGICEPKNLLDDSKRVFAAHNIIFGRDSGGRDDFCLKLKAGTYTFSVTTADGTYTNLYLKNSDTKESISGFPAYATSSKSFTLAEDTNCAVFVYKSDYTSVSDITSAQIEKGSTASEYVPHFEPFTFPPISMETDEGENTLFANEGDSSITYRKAVD